MLKFKTIAPNDLLKIYALNEQKTQLGEIKTVNALGPAKTNLVMPHDSYLVGLSSLKSEEEPKPEVTGMQVIDASINGFKSIFNLYADKDSANQSQLLQDKKYLKSYENAFEKILQLNVDEEDYEVRSLKIPAMNIEALWLHNPENESGDLFTPIRSMGLFEDNKTYGRKDFFGILKDATANFDLTDNLIGG